MKNLYAFSYSDSLANSVLRTAPELERGQFTWGRFRNDEIYLRLLAPPREDCIVLGTIQPSEERLTSFLLLCDTLRRNGARSITAVLPYLAYSRQHESVLDASLAIAWIGRLLQASGVDRVLTMDLHDPSSVAKFPLPLENVSMTKGFAGCIGPVDGNISVVSPDEGSRPRAQALRKALNLTTDEIYCRKTPCWPGFRAELIGAPSKRAIICDDILDTGETLIACCEQLVAAGVERISIYVSHALFTGSNWKRLWELNVDRITCSDSVPGHLQMDRRIAVLSSSSALVHGLSKEETVPA